MKNLIFNGYFHMAILAICFVIMAIDVFLVSKGNSLDEMTVLGKIAGIVFIADLFFFVGYGMMRALFGKK